MSKRFTQEYLPYERFEEAKELRTEPSLMPFARWFSPAVF